MIGPNSELSVIVTHLGCESVISEVVDMNEQNEDEVGVNEEHVDCSNAFNTSQVIM